MTLSRASYPRAVRSPGRRVQPAALAAFAAVLIAPVGCDRFGTPDPPPSPPSKVAPLPIQQAEAYPETVTGLFVSLADFEPQTDPLSPRQRVARRFRIAAPGGGGFLKYTLNVTRTGTGALEGELPADGRLVFEIPQLQDFREYTLLLLAVNVQALRDDFRVTLRTGQAAWRSPRQLVRPGWNAVRVDLQRLGALAEFDARRVRAVELHFDDARSPVRFGLDDVMLIDNRRTIQPTPPGMTLRKVGLDYELKLPGRTRAVRLSQGHDGLWRIGRLQGRVQLAAPGETLPDGGNEDLGPMGDRRIGEVTLLEHNAVRLRLANTWYFPTRAGEWASGSARRIRWEYTFYADGRRVTRVELNNAGGQAIRAVRIRLPAVAAIRGQGQARAVEAADFAGPIGRWTWLIGGADDPQRDRRQFLSPGNLRATVGSRQDDGFDPATGSYVLRSRAGQCRFELRPGPDGLNHPVVHVLGGWRGAVTVSCDGLGVREIVELPDGVLFVVPAAVKRPAVVELSGTPDPLAYGPDGEVKLP